eukprot:TRINITY_DN930_c0_g1::TRINITY_DN930_c0_g1_i1::g.16100::m.16100 TRINITY_DN930_c0_g1::TRINITY_DN930_c0_g1_i1::g.16100  ORF type:complete len:182 (+),score=65.81,sp/Q42347/RL241_ARATH/56.56/8e-38,Ribosomal_L24e/PF01246.15/4.3e-29,Ribosomal_L24e/PF01246.15/2.9e+03 TRINITY_DN930_c0_g1_i1:57-548(+)
MVVKTETCVYSGYKIYPGHGSRFVRLDSKVFIFVDNKAGSSFHRKYNPRKATWTQMYRKAHKKGIQEETQRRARKRTANRSLVRGFEGATAETIKAKRSEKPEVRQIAREAALKEIKERNKASQASKKTATKAAPKAAQATQATKVKQPKVVTKATKGTGARR